MTERLDIQRDRQTLYTKRNDKTNTQTDILDLIYKETGRLYIQRDRETLYTKRKTDFIYKETDRIDRLRDRQT